MAGDTPTPIEQRKEGTPFYGETVEIDFHKGSDALIPFDEVQERRNVKNAFATAAGIQPEALQDAVEITFPPTNVAEVIPLNKQLYEARVYAMEPSETPFLREDAA